MGNCCALESSSTMEWGGEDWDFLKSNNTSKKSSSKVFDESTHQAAAAARLTLGKAQKEKLLGSIKSSASSSTSNDNRNGTVTIRISKKELVELLGTDSTRIIDQKKTKQRVGRASAEQVLLRLIKSRDQRVSYHHDADHHIPWRPVLETIPEV